MNPVRNVATAAANLRPLHTTTGVPHPPPQEKVVEGVESLSLQTKVELSHKAQANKMLDKAYVEADPTTPSAQTRKTRKASAENRKEAEGVSTTDFAGRSCTGTLSGPLLMEDSQALEGFNFDHPGDFQAVFSAGKFLASLDDEVLKAERSPEPLASDQGLAYFGLQDGTGLLVHQGADVPPGPEESQVTLPGGSRVQITRQDGRLSLFLPAESLTELTQWGRQLLAIA